MDARDRDWLGERLASAVGDLVRASGESDGFKRQVKDAVQSFELLAAEAELIALGGSLREARFGREPRREMLREEHRAWRVAHLRDAYLWPEAIRP